MAYIDKQIIDEEMKLAQRIMGVFVSAMEQEHLEEEQITALGCLLTTYPFNADPFYMQELSRLILEIQTGKNHQINSYFRRSFGLE